MVQVTLPNECYNHSLITTQWKLCQAAQCSGTACHGMASTGCRHTGASILWRYTLYSKPTYLEGFVTNKRCIRVFWSETLSTFKPTRCTCKHLFLPVVDPCKQARSAPVSPAHDTLVAQGFRVPAGNCRLYCYTDIWHI